MPTPTPLTTARANHDAARVALQTSIDAYDADPSDEACDRMMQAQADYSAAIAPALTPRARLDEAAERYRLAPLFSDERGQAHQDRQAALADILAEHARWVRDGGGSRANLTGANLTDANLAHANLTDANLTGANLTDANLAHANLTDAYLAGANLTGAYLAGANLTGADLTRADLTDADLTLANLTRADLTRADLALIWQDLDDVLRLAPAEVPALLGALRAGHVDGSTYTGECACLVGTMERAAIDAGRRIDLPHRPERLAERWFMAIRKGDTPENSAVCAITAQYVEWWLSPESEVA